MGFKEFVQEHRSDILSVAAGIGVITTGVLSARSQMKVDELLMNENVKPTKKQIIKSYAPAVISGAITIGCVAAADVMSNEDKKALTKMLLTTEAAFGAYRNYIKKNDPELDRQASESAKERVKTIEQIKEVQVPNRITIVEPFTNVEFTIDETDFWVGLNETNRYLAQFGFASYGDFLEHIGYFRIEGTDDLYWDMEYLCEESGYVYINLDLVPYKNDPSKYTIMFDLKPSISQKENALANGCSYGTYH